ncbi:MAG TPA: nucleotidyl transferase AbiEii/AbiGii toxin family protein [Anaerolineaceae bacterium]|nr:nucleotidyl transferase AbiEii/AbiGii toxin family protein [Anaerolineaceae bacterium]
MKSNLPRAHGLLSPIQKTFIHIFLQLPDQEHFYLTGGTALAEYYLGHRLSYDLDFFTASDKLVLPVSYQLEKLAQENQLVLEVIRRFTTYVEILVNDKDKKLKVDLALDSPFRFLPTVPYTPGIRVNNYIDLCVDKLLAYYGRAEPRDAVDLYFILQSESIEELLELAKRKDPGFDLYWFAVALKRCTNFPDEPDLWPVTMLVDWHPKGIKTFFQSLTLELMDKLE